MPGKKGRVHLFSLPPLGGGVITRAPRLWDVARSWLHVTLQLTVFTPSPRGGAGGLLIFPPSTALKFEEDIGKDSPHPLRCSADRS